MAASASTSQYYEYDVFLSFRGEDTRKTFIDYLYKELVDRMINTYKDDVTLARGESICPALFEAIERSQIVVVIFSENYADSSWCLEELAHIMKCREEGKLVVMPVFYGVDPSDVRKQKRKFGEAFAKHEIENNDRISSWRKALIDASNIAGWEPKNVANGHEMKAIKEIVDKIADKLFSFTHDFDENLVGMRVRLQELETQLNLESPGVRMVGIWGVGGGGKTTIATSLCMKISPCFQGHYCIVDNIREESNKHGLKSLQEKIILCLLKRDTKLQSVSEGRQVIKRGLIHSKVLIVLDDVDHINQLEALVGLHTWFGSGSRIIITTRDKHLLESHKVDHIYPVTLLSDEEATQLFRRRAFDEKKPGKDFEALSSRVVEYAARLPLALKILGSFLCGRGIDEWESTLDRLENNPEMEVVETLKISYDGLKHSEKQMFLDIACFFRWIYTRREMEMAMEIFEACGYDPVIGIKVLEEKALITVVKDKYLLHDMFYMHDLVQEMAHYIVRGDDDPTNPEMHSRVWDKEKIMYLQGEIKENYKIEAIRCYHDDLIPGVFCKIISRMKKLRWLEVSERTRVSYCDGGDAGPTFLSNELRSIYWYKYSSSPFPDGFQPMKLAHLQLKDSMQKELWKGYKYLPSLKVLQLDEMKNLLRTPDFTALPWLQKLKLHNCEEITEVHPSLGNHNNIKNVSVDGCSNLRMFPTIVQMRKLKALTIRECNKSLEFPEIKSDMESLIKLSLEKIGIDALLSSIGERCANLTSLHLYHCFHSKINDFNFDGLKQLDDFEIVGGIVYVEKPGDYYFSKPLRHCYVTQPSISLQKLSLTKCHFRDADTPFVIGDLCNLRELDLSWNDFTRLHYSLSKLTQLKLLNLSFCPLLVELPELPSGLVELRAFVCPKLKAIGDVYKNCKWLSTVSLTGGAIIHDGSRLLTSMLQGSVVQNHNMVLKVEGFEIAKWFRPPLVRGPECRLQLPENWFSDFSGFLICTVQNYSKYFQLEVVTMEQVMVPSTPAPRFFLPVDTLPPDSEKYITVVWYVSFASLRHATWWNEAYNELLFTMDTDKPGDFGNTSGCGVRLVPRKSGSGARQTSTTQVDTDFSHYAPEFRNRKDSEHGLSFSLHNV